jgi:hypothetical protein
MQLPDPQIGHDVRRLQLPTSSRIIPRPAAIVRAEFTSRLTLTANDLGPAMISAVKHAASIRNPEFDARQRARRSTWDTPRFLYSYDETAEGDLVLPRGLHPLLTILIESADSTLHVDDKRILGQPHKFTCTTPLRTVQTTALRLKARHPWAGPPCPDGPRRSSPWQPSAWLGHPDVSFTMRTYVHAQPEALELAALLRRPPIPGTELFAHACGDTDRNLVHWRAK